MRIDFVNDRYLLGGAETVVRQLHERCLAEGHDSRLWIASSEPDNGAVGVKRLYPQSLGRLRHTRFKAFMESVYPRARWTERRFRRLAKEDTEVVHVHTFHGDYAPLDAFAGLAAVKPVVWTFHGCWGVTGGCNHPGDCNRYLDACGECPRVHEWPMFGTDNTAEGLAKKKRFLSAAPLTVVAPSHHLARRIRESPVGRGWRVETIHNGVDTVAFNPGRKRDPVFRRRLGLRDDALIVLTVNRDFNEPKKGHQFVERALLDAGMGDAVQVVLAGGNSTDAIARLKGRIDCADFGYVSSRTRLADLYEAADIFLFASPGENFPCVILEAMAAGCCVTATPTDGTLEQIEDGRSGLLSEEISGPSLALALRRALEDETLRCACGVEARRRAIAEFSEDIMVRRYFDLYEELVRVV